MRARSRSPHDGELSRRDGKPQGLVVRMEISIRAASSLSQRDGVIARVKLGRERLVVNAGVFEEGNRLEAVVAGVAMPEIDAAVRFFLDPFGDGDRLTALGARILLGQVTKA